MLLNLIKEVTGKPVELVLITEPSQDPTPLNGESIGGTENSITDFFAGEDKINIGGKLYTDVLVSPDFLVSAIQNSEFEIIVDNLDNPDEMKLATETAYTTTMTVLSNGFHRGARTIRVGYSPERLIVHPFVEEGV